MSRPFDRPTALVPSAVGGDLALQGLAIFRGAARLPLTPEATDRWRAVYGPIAAELEGRDDLEAVLRVLSVRLRQQGRIARDSARLSGRQRIGVSELEDSIRQIQAISNTPICPSAHGAPLAASVGDAGLERRA